MVTDANGNRTAVGWTPLGLVSKVALMGKAGQSEGDTLDSPTEEFIYDFDCFEASGTPIHVRTRRREVHGSAACRWLESVEYSDGAGRIVLAKAVAEPGKYRAVENGAVVEKDSGTDVRWVGSGRTVYNNAGNPVKQYEPYFSGTDAYESEPAIVETGVTPVLHYDALCREALEKGANMDKLFGIDAREKIGRAKMADPKAFEEAYDAIDAQMKSEIDAVIAGGEDA